MTQTVRGVISRTRGEPVEVVDVVIPDPGPGEVVVDIAACGVCHTDLTYREGGINDEYPFLLGHEAAGTVEAVGPGVTSVEPGDFVVLNWRAVCGRCRACRRGRPWYCFDTHNAEQKMTLTDGTELTPALGIGAFIDKTLVHEGQCTRVDPAADPAVAGLLGCGVMAGLGAAINTGAVSRDDTVAVIGCGGVGDAAIAGRRLSAPSGSSPSTPMTRKLAWAKDFGATHTINARSTDVVEAIQVCNFCLATVMAPDKVITTKHSVSRAMASSTSAASPTWRPVNAVFPMASTRSLTVRTELRSRDSSGINRSSIGLCSLRSIPVPSR